jgi:hypothetical protein
VKPPETIVVDMGWIRDLNHAERAQFAKQAMDLGAHFEPRERENITGVFLNLTSVGLWLSVGAKEAQGVESVVPTDWTTPTDQFRDDLGTAVAFILRLTEDPTTFPAVRAGWSEVMDDLKRQMGAL